MGSVPSSQRVLFGDIDGNGSADVITYDPSDGTTAVVINDGGSLADTEPVGTLPTGSMVRAADVDGDGDDDIVYVSSSGGEVKVRPTSEETDEYLAAVTWGAVPDNTDFALADVDRDGAADLLTRAKGDGRVQLASSNGSEFLAQRLWGNFPSKYELNFFDITGDMAADAVGRHQTDGRVATAASQLATRVQEAGEFVPDSDLEYDDGESNDGSVAVARAAAGTPPPACDTAAAKPTAGKLALAWADPGALSNSDPAVQTKAVQRIVESGATRARFMLLQNAWMSNVNGIRENTERAVSMLVACGVRPLINMTGAVYDSFDPDGGGDGLPPHPPAGPLGPRPRPSNEPIATAGFASFVTSVVATLEPL